MKEPLVVMLLLMVLMFAVAFVCRMWSIKFGSVKLSHYETFGVSSEPEYVIKTTNNLNNLFQLPLVFIAACVLSISLGHTSDALIYNSWGFVISRCLHTIVHVTVNWVLMRSVSLAVGLYFLVVIWLELLSIIP